jgi:hypothetical protein
VLSSALGNALAAGGGNDAEAAARRFGLVEYDSVDLDYSFRHPRKWISVKNNLRRGVVVSDFGTTDKVYVEVFSRPPRNEILEEAAVASMWIRAATSVAPGQSEAGAVEAGGAGGEAEAEKRVTRARAVHVLVVGAAQLSMHKSFGPNI